MRRELLSSSVIFLLHFLTILGRYLANATTAPPTIPFSDTTSTQLAITNSSDTISPAIRLTDAEETTKIMATATTTATTTTTTTTTTLATTMITTTVMPSSATPLKDWHFAVIGTAGVLVMCAALLFLLIIITCIKRKGQNVEATEETTKKQFQSCVSELSSAIEHHSLNIETKQEPQKQKEQAHSRYIPMMIPQEKVERNSILSVEKNSPAEMAFIPKGSRANMVQDQPKATQSAENSNERSQSDQLYDALVPTKERELRQGLEPHYSIAGYGLSEDTDMIPTGANECYGTTVAISDEPQYDLVRKSPYKEPGDSYDDESGYVIP